MSISDRLKKNYQIISLDTKPTGKVLKQLEVLVRGLATESIALIRKQGYKDNAGVRVEDDVASLREGIPNQIMHLLMCSDDVVGYVSLFYFDDRCDVSNLYIKSGYRGFGLGRKLLTHTIDTAKESGCKYVSLRVVANNEPARKLYASLGLQPFTLALRKAI